jgi:glycosyltransferase involved in cell wall biosynthesis
MFIVKSAMTNEKEKPKFSIVLIARNESQTLPRLINSLTEFQSRGGEVLLLDTGSTDDTANIARNLGCRVIEVGDKFRKVITKDLADQINGKFIIENEPSLFKEGDSLFDYASARNFIAEHATTDMIATPDCDEIYTKFDIDKINQAIDEGAEQLEYNFVFSHDEYGNPAIQFIHSKFYNRNKLKWVGIVHEVLSGGAVRKFLPESIIKLEHYQNEKTNRSGYLRGLALDCFENPDNDRNSHYFGRELIWTGRFNSGIQELKRHVAMNRWPTERAQSMIYIGNAYGFLNKPDQQAEWYFKSFYSDGSRREPLIQLANFFMHNRNYPASIAMAHGALQLDYTGFYGTDMRDYTVTPHEILYRAYGWTGKIDLAYKHLLECLKHEPLNEIFLRDLRFYSTLPKISVIIPTLGRPDGLKRCINSITSQNYPAELIQIVVKEGEEGTVITKVNDGLKEADGEFIIYGSNDIEFDRNAFILAVYDYLIHKKRLIAFDTGVRNAEGYINEHFMIKRDLIDELGGYIFDPDFHHVGVDDLLWKRCEKRNEAMISSGRAIHHHFSRIGSGIEPDEIIKKGWAHQAEDAELLAKKLKELNEGK